MAKKSEWVYDALLSYLGDAFFQIPVVTFMEERCIIFDQDGAADKEYREVHKEYISVVSELLKCFMKDLGLNYDEVIKALKEMNKKKDLRDVFQVIFDQVLYLEDYEMFKNAMISKNIELEEQALLYVMKQTGRLPENYQKGVEPSVQKGRDAMTVPPAMASLAPAQDETFQKILQEPEQPSAKQKEAAIAAATVPAIEVEAELYRVQELKIKQEEKMYPDLDTSVGMLAGVSITEKSTPVTQKPTAVAVTQKPSAPQTGTAKFGTQTKPSKTPDTMVTPSKPVGQTDLKSAPQIAITPAPAKVQAAPVPGATKGRPPAQQPLSSGPALQSGAALPAINKQSQVSGSEAAANWLKSAKDESSNTPSSAVMAAAAKYSNMDPEELKKRQQFFMEQRKKLLEKKKQEREKQLLTAEKAQPQRPMSARAAKAALKEEPAAKKNPEDEKTIAMRRALYNCLKTEVIENKH